MKKLDKKDAKEIGENIGIDWKKVNLDEFIRKNSSEILER